MVSYVEKRFSNYSAAGASASGAASVATSSSSSSSSTIAPAFFIAFLDIFTAATTALSGCKKVY